MQGFFSGDQNKKYLFPANFLSMSLSLSKLCSWPSNHSSREREDCEIRTLQLTFFWHLQSLGSNSHLKWFVYSSISINSYAAEMITKSRVGWRTKLSFWSTFDHLSVIWKLLLICSKVTLLSTDCLWPPDTKITISIPSPTRVFPLRGFISLHGTSLQVTDKTWCSICFSEYPPTVMDPVGNKDLNLFTSVSWEPRQVL